MTLNSRNILSHVSFILVLLIYIIVPSVDFLPFKDPSVTGKFIAFSFLIEITALLFFIKKISNAAVISFTYLDILCIGIVSFITIGRYLFQPDYGFSIRYFELIGLLVLYFILKDYGNKKFLYWLCLAAVVGANIQIIIANLQLYGFLESDNSFFKATGSFFNSGPLAGYLASTLPLSIFMLRDNRTENYRFPTRRKIQVLTDKIARYFFIFNIVGCLSLIPVLQSRAAFLSLACVTALLYRKRIFVLLRKVGKQQFTKYIGLLILITGIVAGAYFLISFKQESSRGRFLILKVTMNMVKDKPVLGFGYDRFRSAYMKYQAQYFKSHSGDPESVFADDIFFAFDDPLQSVVENGIVGFSIIALFFYLLIRYAKKDKRFYDLGVTGLTGVSIFSLFSYPSEILAIKLVFLLYILMLASNYDGPYLRMKVKDIRTRTSLAISTIALILVTLVAITQCFEQTLRWKVAYAEWGQAYRDYRNHRFTESEMRYEKIYQDFRRSGEFLTDYGKALFFTHQYVKGIRILQQASLYSDDTFVETALGDCQRSIRDYSSAEQSYLTACLMKPNSFYNKYLLFKLYEDTGQMDKAFSVAMQITGLKVKVQSQVTEYIRNEANSFLQGNAPPTELHKFLNIK